MKKNKTKFLLGSLIIGGMFVAGTTIPLLSTQSENKIITLKQAGEASSDATTSDSHSATAKPDTSKDDTSDISISDPNQVKLSKMFVPIVAIGGALILLVIIIAICIEIWYRHKKNKKEYLPLFE